MKEIVNIQLGNCGNAIGSEFWKSLFDDHRVDETSGQFIGECDYQLEKIEVFFNQTHENRYTPRSIFADLEQAATDKYRTSGHFSFMEPDNFLSGNQLSHGNYSNRYDLYRFNDHLMDIVRKEAENSDSLQGFQIFHSASGAAGSGLTSLLLDSIKDEYSDRIIKTSSIIPFTASMNYPTESYDTIFMLQNLISNCEITSIINNEDIHNFCFYKMKQYKPDLNHMICQVLHGESLSFRFTTDLCSDLRKFAMNLVPYPNLHFLTQAFCPFSSRGSVFCYFNVQSIGRLTTNLFNKIYHPFDPNPNSTIGPILCGIITYLGSQICPAETELEFSQIKTANKNCFLEQIPDNLKYWICCARSFYTRSGYFIYNSASMGKKWKNAIDQFDVLFQRKAFKHKYLGMDELEFEEARESAMQLVSEYQQLLINSNSNEYLLWLFLKISLTIPYF